MNGPSVTYELSEADYHADTTALSQSMAKELLKPGGPARLRWRLDNPQPRRDYFDFGRAAHAEVLGVGAEWVEAPYSDFRPKAARDWKAEQEASGLTVLSATDAAKVRGMAHELSLHPEAMSVLSGHREVSIYDQDDETGVMLRARLDAVSTHIVGDYKTALSADPELFARRSMLTYGYHMQAAHYLDMAVRAGLTSDSAQVVFVVQEKEPPYLAAVITVGHEYLELGRRDMRRAIDLWAQCTRTGNWPGYEPTTAEPPMWALDDLYEMEVS